jgi:hypothetical protein
MACPAVDIDFLLVETKYGKPCALVEYKHVNAKAVDPLDASYRALVALADGYTDGPLPCFVARYDPQDWSFSVLPLNDAAQKHYAHCLDERLTEQRFVRSLYLLRKSVLTAQDKAAIAQLNGREAVCGY